MRLTEAEKSHILANRYRIELDNQDWSREPHLTQCDLLEMSPHVARRLIAEPTWRLDPFLDVFVNTKLEQQTTA